MGNTPRTLFHFLETTHLYSVSGSYMPGEKEYQMVLKTSQKGYDMGLVEFKMPKPLTKLLNMSRRYSMWVYQWGLACCAIEMEQHFAPTI